MKFRKRPIVIEAWQWLGQPHNEWPRWVSDGARVSQADSAALAIHTLEGELSARLGDWLIHGIRGEVYPCKPNVFSETYDPVPDSQDDGKDE